MAKPDNPGKPLQEEESVQLRFRSGSSDKVYNINLSQKDNGWVVNFAYGRYGKPLSVGSKTREPVPYAKAKKAFDSLRDAKINKGYYGTEAGGVVVDPATVKKPTGWVPQLLNPIEEEQLPQILLDWQAHVMVQLKHDGERRGILLTDKVTAANRKGHETTVHPEILEQLETLLTQITFDTILDCEDMGESLVIFDVIQVGADTDRFRERAEHLEYLAKVIARCSLNRLRVDLPAHIHSLEHLTQYVQDARDNNEEGIVLRWPNSLYTPGRPNSGGEALKLKFYESATCIVDSQHPVKRSVGLVLLEDGDRIPVGNCTIPPNYDIPRIGDLVEIKYLYAYRGGSLYQPQYKGVRVDISIEDATTQQLKYKE